MQRLTHLLVVGSRNLPVELMLALALVQVVAVGGVEGAGRNPGEGVQQGLEGSGFGT